MRFGRRLLSGRYGSDEISISTTPYRSSFVLGFTQLLKEMSKARQVCVGNQFTAISQPSYRKCGILDSSQSHCRPEPVTEIVLHLYIDDDLCHGKHACAPRTVCYGDSFTLFICRQHAYEPPPSVTRAALLFHM
jgi:hypothetical protein